MRAVLLLLLLALHSVCGKPNDDEADADAEAEADKPLIGDDDYGPDGKDKINHRKDDHRDPTVAAPVFVPIEVMEHSNHMLDQSDINNNIDQSDINNNINMQLQRDRDSKAK